MSEAPLRHRVLALVTASRRSESARVSVTPTATGQRAYVELPELQFEVEGGTDEEILEAIRARLRTN